jgi:hypothetical protein
MEVTQEAIKRMSDDEWQQLMTSIGFGDLQLKKDNLTTINHLPWLLVINVAIKKRDVRERIDKLAREKAAREQARASDPSAPQRRRRPTPPPPRRPATPEQRGIAKIREEVEHRRMLTELAKIREELEHRRRPPSENPAALIEREEKKEALARVDALLEAERLLATHAEALRLQEQPLEGPECCICLKQLPISDLLTLVPCGHRCVCGNCALFVIGTPCPLCRKLVTDSLKVYD